MTVGPRHAVEWRVEECKCKCKCSVERQKADGRLDASGACSIPHAVTITTYTQCLSFTSQGYSQTIINISAPLCKCPADALLKGCPISAISAALISRRWLPTSNGTAILAHSSDHSPTHLEQQPLRADDFDLRPSIHAERGQCA